MFFWKAFRYWSYDKHGVTIGGLFTRNRFLFQEMIDIEVIEYPEIRGVTYIKLCFFNKNDKMLAIHIQFFSKEEIDWLKQQGRIDQRLK